MGDDTSAPRYVGVPLVRSVDAFPQETRGGFAHTDAVTLDSGGAVQLNIAISSFFVKVLKTVLLPALDVFAANDDTIHVSLHPTHAVMRLGALSFTVGTRPVTVHIDPTHPPGRATIRVGDAWLSVPIDGNVLAYVQHP